MSEEHVRDVLLGGLDHFVEAFGPAEHGGVEEDCSG
jgi:hypothetical protein